MSSIKLYTEDLQIAKALINRDEGITRQYLYKRCYPLFKSIYDNYYTDCNSVIEFIDQTKHSGYYYKMGCAWCLQVIMVKYPDLCYNYLECNHLDDWTFNKAISKMIESYRISNDMKDKIRKLKRK